MLNHAILWAYSSVWRAPVVGLRQTLDTLETLAVHPEDVIVERDAFERVMQKARVGVTPAVWHNVQLAGWC